MIVVTSYINANDKMIGFEINGHANIDSINKEIVCASVSVLSQTIMLSLIDCLDIDCYYKIEKGYLFLLIKNYKSLNQNLCDDVDLLFNTLLLGLKNIDKNYENNLDFQTFTFK